MPIDERTLPRLLLTGMIGIVLLLTLALGGYNLLHVISNEESDLQWLEQDELARRERLLRSEMESAVDYIRFTRSRTESILKGTIRSQTDQAYQLAESIWQKQRGKQSESEIRKLIVEALRPLRFFQGRGYVFIDDTRGQCILLPIAPQREGGSLWDNRDDTGHYIMRGLVSATENQERAGYSSYRWYAPDSPQQMRDKIAYVRHFAPFDWIIGTGEYLHQVDQDLQSEVLQRMQARRFGKAGRISAFRRTASGDIDILAGPMSETVGRTLSSLPADDPQRWMITRVAALAEQDSPASQIDWPGADGQVGRSLALVSNVSEWGWFLVASVDLSDLDAQLRERSAEAHATTWRMARDNVLIASLLMALALLFAFAYGKWMSRLFRNYQANISRQHRALAASAQQQVLASTVFRNSQEAIFITDGEARIIDANPAFENLTGYPRDEAIGQTPRLLSSGRHDAAFYQELYRTLAEKGAWQGEIWNRRKDGRIFPEWLSVSTVVDQNGRLTHYIASFSDMTERKDAEERLRQMAEYDALTALPNRHLLTDRVQQAIPAAQRGGHALALMFLDLDRFKTINDSLGHAVGDELLISVADRLRQVVRSVDTVSRIGGDEFVILLPKIEHDSDAGRVAEKIIDVISRPVELNGHRIEITTSVGIALYPEDGQDVSTLMKNADAAMYYAKELGRNNFQFFTNELNTRTHDRFAREKELRQALERGEIQLYYQPQVLVRTGRIVGCEALLRWQHPTLGLLLPGEFIDLAEECGLIEVIGRWVLREACRQAMQWRNQGLPPLRMAVNVSPSQLRNPEFPDEVLAILAASGLPPDALELEITENVLVDSNPRLKDTLQDLVDHGVRLALDDFGTGYSNLTYLKRLPIQRLKIDRSFVSDIPTDALDATLTTAIAGLADNFGLATLAEGVETAEQHEFLAELGCDEAQGFHFHRPMPADELAALLRTPDAPTP